MNTRSLIVGQNLARNSQEAESKHKNIIDNENSQIGVAFSFRKAQNDDKKILKAI